MYSFLSLKKNYILTRIINIAGHSKREVYLVGGLIRDLFLRRESFDFDFAVDKDALKFARFVSRKIGGNFVVLDREHGSARVIKKYKGVIYTLDFTDFRGRDIYQDLTGRDFTINAICFNILLLKKATKIQDIIIDPFDGVKDIKKKIIRVINSRTFLDDPLRMLRAFSMPATLDFSIDKKTINLIIKNRRKISSVSAERIREELFKILAQVNTAEIFKRMDKILFLDKVILELNITRGVIQGPYHHLDVMEHSFEAVYQLDRLLLTLKRNKKISAYLGEIIAGQHSRRQLLKFATLLHDIGKPGSLTREEGKTKFHGHEYLGRKIAVSICDRLKISTKEKEAIKTMVFWHLRPGYLADNLEITKRAKFRYFRDTADEGISVLLLSVADQRATRGPLTHDESRIQHEKTCRWLMKEYFKRKEEKRLPRLITGYDLMKKLKLLPGPVFSLILNEVEEEQAAGEISSKKEALDLARIVLAKDKKRVK